MESLNEKKNLSQKCTQVHVHKTTVDYSMERLRRYTDPTWQSAYLVVFRAIVFLRFQKWKQIFV